MDGCSRESPYVLACGSPHYLRVGVLADRPRPPQGWSFCYEVCKEGKYPPLWAHYPGLWLLGHNPYLGDLFEASSDLTT
jgi:hypothetical protein